ncbi:MAG TPA: hypothetical protein VFH89_04770 [Sphingomicrobium sp.]|nr:hypothetical protein [Sphingomicrobium sp.]
MIVAIAKLFGVPSWMVTVGLVVLAIAGAGIGKCAYDRSVVQRHEQKAQLKQVKRERKADTNLQIQTGRDEAAAQQRQKEIENATRNIPDQAPSARQRARACLELQRQAAERRQPKPAC